MDLFLADLADALREVRDDSREPIALIAEMAGSVEEQHRPAVAHLIRQRVATAPPNEVLAAFYVLDSVVKTVGGSYVSLLAEGLPRLFADNFLRAAFGRTRLTHMLDTWSTVFPAALVAETRALVPAPPGAAPPPEKRARIVSAAEVTEQALSLEQQTRAELAALEAQIRRQPQGPTPQQRMALEGLRSIVMELIGNSNAAVLPVTPFPPLVTPFVSVPAPAPAPPAPITVLPMQVAASSAPQMDSNVVRALDTLYLDRLAGVPCPTCALRFRDKPSYETHMDWHFKQNKLAQGKSRNVHSRTWFLTAAAWHADSEVALATAVPFESASSAASTTATTSDPSIPRLVADPNFKNCVICNETLETVWDDDESEWMFVNAAHTNSGFAHAVCLKKA